MIIEPDIPLLDEVLAVGDAAFKEKFKARIAESERREHRFSLSRSIGLKPRNSVIGHCSLIEVDSSRRARSPRSRTSLK